MNKELQKTMCEQLPYGTLKFWDEENPEYIPTLIGIPNNEMLRFSLPRFPGNIDLSNSELKPILRRMDLTKPITHKGETFTPIRKMFGINEADEFKIVQFKNHVAIDESYENGVFRPRYTFYAHDLSRSQADFLSELHFNWRNIPDELVKYTDEFDYEIY